MWVEVPHAPVAAPPHTEFRPFSPVRWVRANPSAARTAALALAVISTALLGLAAWPQNEAQQAPAVITQSATSDPLLSRPLVTPPAEPPTVFTSQAATPSSAAATGLAPARDAAPARAEEKKSPAAPASAPPAGSRSERTTASSPSSRGFVPPLPPSTPPARSREVLPPPAAAEAVSSTTITTSRPPVDRAPLILSSPAREPVASPVATPAPAPAPPPPLSPEARDKAAVESVVERYRLAFSTLNSGVSDFWPGVPSRALDKAFNDLDQQRFEFDQCRVQLNGAQADATCTGTATFVPKVGNKTPRTQPRQWSFRLVRAGNRWIIDSVQTR